MHEAGCSTQIADGKDRGGATIYYYASFHGLLPFTTCRTVAHSGRIPEFEILVVVLAETVVS